MMTSRSTALRTPPSLLRTAAARRAAAPLLTAPLARPLLLPPLPRLLRAPADGDCCRRCCCCCDVMSAIIASRCLRRQAAIAAELLLLPVKSCGDNDRSAATRLAVDSEPDRLRDDDKLTPRVPSPAGRLRTRLDVGDFDDAARRADFAALPPPTLLSREAAAVDFRWEPEVEDLRFDFLFLSTLSALSTLSMLLYILNFVPFTM